MLTRSYDRRTAWIFGLLLVAIILAVYLPTVQPVINGSSDLYAEDVGEFQNVLTQWGTAHPTGYPLYDLTGALVTSLLRSVGLPPAAAASAFSMLVMLVAVSGVYLLLLAVGLSLPLSVGTATLLGVTFPYWYHASVAEVYALLIVLLVFTLLIASQWRADRKSRHLYELAFVFGLAVGHHRLAVLIAPALLVLVWPVFWATLRERPLRFFGALFSLLASFLIYLYLPLRAWMGGSWIYGQPNTWQGFWAIVLAREYGPLIRPASNLGQTEVGLLQVITTLADSITWPLLVAGAIGYVVALTSAARRWLALALLALLVVNVAFASVFSQAVFLPAALMPAMLAAICGVGFLAQWLTDQLRRGLIVSGCALAIAVVALSYGNGPAIYAMTHDQSGQAIIDNVRAAELVRLTEHPAVMALWGRDHFALAYGQRVTGELAGIEMVDHRADVKGLITSGHTLYVLRPTFYLRPLAWWNARLGHAYLSSYAGDLVRVSDRPILREEDVPANRSVSMTPAILLRDWQVEPLGDGRWHITLYWQAIAKPDRDFSVFVHASDRSIIDSPDAIVAQADTNAPVYGWYPTSLWSPGEIVRDDSVIAPPPDRPAKMVEVGLYTQDGVGNFQNFGKQVIPLR